MTPRERKSAVRLALEVKALLEETVFNQPVAQSQMVAVVVVRQAQEAPLHLPPLAVLAGQARHLPFLALL